MKLGYVILYVPDVAKAVAFYGKAFGLDARMVAEGGAFAELKTGETALAFAEEDMVETMTGEFRRNRPDGVPAGAEIGLVVEDVAQAYWKALDAGAVGVAPPKEKPWGQVVAYVRDLNGFLVEICTAA
ncbi:VOC family protein [Labrys monachus]|uniref:Catechol 2,3-dioxygenase-like lactoylglutathione lyase family enzyme n=1 Tax=Labrys monachus TaxID=217067 RepID=A0ABU0FP58_9HYPH|nr:VOC family protein [Labrys monachus]MDQ0396395.1 catechol 2,3-dioxygenase-like lactoylglutathione lyase family enzyme [Labrys monachus]